MDIEIKERTKVKASIYGKDYLLSKPTVGQIEDMQAQAEKEESSDKKSALMRKWVSGLGLPEAVSSEMEIDHFLQVVEVLTGTKKK